MMVHAPAALRFPRLGWAWPSGDLDLLLRAAAHSDAAEARAAFGVWLATRSLDDASFRDHRLLAGIAARFGRAGLADLPEYPRLAGLQRQLWTRSRMAFADNLPALARLAERGVTVMLLKGGARIAAQPEAIGARLAHDLDILVPAGQVGLAVDALYGQGWRPTTGESLFALRARAGQLRSVNFQAGRFGDIDLHRLAMGRDSQGVDAALWQGACRGAVLGQPVLYPDPAGLLATSLWHSGLDAHVHSDWIVDCAATIARGGVDWDRALWLVKAGGCALPALIALSYIARPLGGAVPEAVISALARASPAGIARVATLLQARPRSQWSGPVRLARGVVKQVRLARERHPDADERPLRLRYGGRGRLAGDAGLDVLLGQIAQGVGRVRLELELAVVLPDRPRRLCLELHTATGHVARLRYGSALRPKGAVRLVLAATITLPDKAGGPLWLASRPARHLRPTATEEERARYAALPVAALRVLLTPQP